MLSKSFVEIYSHSMAMTRAMHTGLQAAIFAYRTDCKHRCSIQVDAPETDHAHAGSRARVTSMGGLYDAATLRALMRFGFPCFFTALRYHMLLLPKDICGE